MTETAAKPGDMRSERDRFVALAFCWADLMLELDRSRTVVFAAGITDAILGQAGDRLQGKALDDLVVPEDRDLVHELMGVAENRGRIENVTVRLIGAHAPSAPLQMAGYFLPDLGNHFFLSFRVGPATNLKHPGKHLDRDRDTGLYDAEAFSEVAQSCLGATADTTCGAPGEDKSLTLVQLKGFEAFEERLDEDGREQFDRTVGACLRAHSVDGDSAGAVAPGRYSLVHVASLDVSELEDKIADYAEAADPENQGIEVDTATVEVDTQSLSEQDLATGLMILMNRFRESKGQAFTLKDLNQNLSDLVEEAVRSVEGFKGLVSAGEFGMRFQPIARIDSGSFHHYEVLASFPQSTHHGSPYKYITFAEETGLICDFDMAMVQKAIHWLATENPDGHYRLAVNLSGFSIGVLAFVAELHEILARNAWAHRGLIFEITESSRIPDLDSANKFIQSLRARGHEVCLDDFGAGAANFQYLSALEVDVIKLDGEALKQSMAGPRGKAFLKALATLCDELGIDIIAEMVDNMSTLQFIKECGIAYAQGYLFGRPSEDILSFNAKQRRDW